MSKLLEVFSVRLPAHWLAWIRKNYDKPTLFVRDAVLAKMWENGFDKNRKEEMSDE